MAKTILTPYNLTPNFTIVLPGKCNAKCNFCFWTERPEAADFLPNLKTILLNKPKNFRQISITGGEPCLSPQLVPVLKLLEQFKKAGHLDKIVLSTNGSALLYKLSRHKCMTSRHQPTYDENLKVFETDFIPDDQELTEAFEIANMMGIDVTLNCVINDKTQSGLIHQMVQCAKRLGATHVSFRKEHGDLDPTPVEKTFKDYASHESSCPVCRTKEQLLNGMEINWKCSVPEPINTPGFLKGKMIYEVIYHPDAKLTSDWKALHDVQFLNGFVLSGSRKTAAIDTEIEKIFKRMGISDQAKPALKKIVKMAPPTLPRYTGGCGTGRSC